MSGEKETGAPGSGREGRCGGWWEQQRGRAVAVASGCARRCLWRVLIPVTTACLGLFAVGVAGNVLTVLVVRACCDLKTATNLYPGSVARSDLLILLGLPLDLRCLWCSWPWVLGQLRCRVSRYLSEGWASGAALRITALAVERYLAICFPLEAKAVVTQRRVKAVIGALWAFAFPSAVPFFFLVGVEQADDQTDFSRECKPTPQAVESGLLGTVLRFTTTYFVLPVACLHVLYGCIGRQLWQSRVPTWPSGRRTIRILGECPQTASTVGACPTSTGTEMPQEAPSRYGGSGLCNLLVAFPRWRDPIYKHSGYQDDLPLLSQYFNVFALQLFWRRRRKEYTTTF